MVTAITAAEFRDFDGVQDWRAGADAASAVFATGSFAAGVRFVTVIGDLAESADHHPDVDLRYPSVTVHLSTHEVGGLSERDVALARQISAAARDLGIEARPGD
ncbi:MAG: 4a-hydroxytetrahydrobiopterin dehydratase [Nocardioides sp.]|uniref:4a-hydroxytetrahydrobiopterin dehydratase n=1 Tax=Nocardioides sp. TaxID=35761 RepID=UPI0039E4E636